MSTIRWGMIGCGDVTEVKSGPAFHKAEGSTLAAVMRRDADKARDYARRHGVARVHVTADALIDDPEIDAVYIATPPVSHCELALRVAAAGKPCLVEKPMAMNPAECERMNGAFQRANARLWVAYYRRALPRFLTVRRLLQAGTIGPITSVHVEVFQPLPDGERAGNWRFDPAVAGAGLFFDLASHCFDLLDFLIAPVSEISGIALNTAGAYAAEDVTATLFRLGDRVAGTGLFNFNAGAKRDWVVVTGSAGQLRTPVFADDDVSVSDGKGETVHEVRNPPHVHQPLVQAIVDELHGKGVCESTGESGARASWVLERAIAQYYARG